VDGEIDFKAFLHRSICGRWSGLEANSKPFSSVAHRRIEAAEKNAVSYACPMHEWVRLEWPHAG
jgi:hypothetical protein